MFAGAIGYGDFPIVLLHYLYPCLFSWPALLLFVAFGFPWLIWCADKRQKFATELRATLRLFAYNGALRPQSH
jgi:hypothetical protein